MTRITSPGNVSEHYSRILTPGLYARAASKGKWKLARHLAYLDERVHLAIMRGGGRIIISMPPRHGKSQYVSTYLPPWYLGRFPDHRVILCGYGATFAKSFGRKCRGLLNVTGDWFPQRPRLAQDSRAADVWNIEGRDGGMQTAGIGGPLTGFGANLFIVDDPIKDSKTALSTVLRENIWEWWTGTAYNRLEPGGTIIVMHTRWHEDDLAGRLLRDAKTGGESWELISFPAIAEDHDILGRVPGDPLWPERYNHGALELLRLGSSIHWWSALYQQRPVPRSGGMFREKGFEQVIDAGSLPVVFDAMVRYWDKAATKGGGAYTVGALMGRKGNAFYLLDVVREQMEPSGVEDCIRATADRDAAKYGATAVQIWVEQDNKYSAFSTTQRLKGYRVHVETPKGKKEDRAEPFAIACQSGDVFVVRAGWNHEYVREMISFPMGKHDDQVDASAGAYRKLVMPECTFVHRLSLVESVTLAGPRSDLGHYHYAVGAVEYAQNQGYAAFVVLGGDLTTKRFGVLHAQEWDAAAFPGGKIPQDVVVGHIRAISQQFRVDEQRCLRGVSLDPTQCESLGVALAQEGVNPCLLDPTPANRRDMAVAALHTVGAKECDFYPDSAHAPLLAQIVGMGFKQLPDRGFLWEPPSADYPAMGVAWMVAALWARWVRDAESAQ